MKHTEICRWSLAVCCWTVLMVSIHWKIHWLCNPGFKWDLKWTSTRNSPKFCCSEEPQLIASNLGKTAKTVPEEGKMRNYILSNLFVFICVHCMGRYGSCFHPGFVKRLFLSSGLNKKWLLSSTEPKLCKTKVQKLCKLIGTASRIVVS